MNVLNQLYKLPPVIDYLGFTFTLMLRRDNWKNLYLGYFLTGCYSKKKYKKQAFQLGLWSEKDRVTLDSVESDYLMKVLVLDDDFKTVETLIKHLKSNGLQLRETTEIQTIDTEFQELNFNLLK